MDSINESISSAETVRVARLLVDAIKSGLVGEASVNRTDANYVLVPSDEVRQAMAAAWGER